MDAGLDQSLDAGLEFLDLPLSHDHLEHIRRHLQRLHLLAQLTLGLPMNQKGAKGSELPRKLQTMLPLLPLSQQCHRI